MDGTTLYIDNFRGFRDTYIPLKSVNFFVGENSTGKTSILSLLYLLSTTAFWHNINFNIDPIHLGGPDDILTNKENPIVTIGLFDEGYSVDMEPEDIQPYVTFFHASMVIKLFIGDKVEIKEIYTAFSDTWTGIKLNHDKKNNSLIMDVHEGDYLEQHYEPRSFMKEINESKSSKIINTKKYINTNNIETLSEFIEDENAKEFYFYSLISGSFDDSGIFLHDLTWLAPIRAKPLPYYENFELPFDAEGRHTPFLLKKILQSGDEKFSEEIDRFGEESGLWKKVSIKDYNMNGSSSAPFEISINRKDQAFKITNVGYGVAQILPILVESIQKKMPLAPQNKFCIQQPEVHLHPKAQSALGSLFYRLAARGRGFLIETHSDFLIDRFRLAMYQDESEHKPSAQVLFFESDGATNKVTPIQILPNGAYSEDQPESFQAFFINELKLLLQIPC